MKLTTREIEIMQILWESEEPLTVAEIVERDENGTIDSVQRITKKSYKKEFYRSGWLYTSRQKNFA